LKIALVNVTKILKKKVLGLFNSSIEILVGTDESYTFATF
jgi:hypothetical protein